MTEPGTTETEKTEKKETPPEKETFQEREGTSQMIEETTENGTEITKTMKHQETVEILNQIEGETAPTTEETNQDQ